MQWKNTDPLSQHVLQIKASAPQDGRGPHFYSLLYSALLRNPVGSLDDPVAKEDLLLALATPYAAVSGDFMCDVAAVLAASKQLACLIPT